MSNTIFQGANNFTGTKHSFTSSASCHHPQCSVFPARSLRARNCICGLVTTGECCYTYVPQAIRSTEYLTHVTFTCIGEHSVTSQRISYPAPDPLRTKFNPHLPHTRKHSSAGSRTRPSNAGNWVPTTRVG